MAKACYSDYVAHCLRFYCRNDSRPEHMGLIDRRNWEACENALKVLSGEERKTLRGLYAEGDNINDAIRATGAMGPEANALWGLVKRAERLVAEERGLV